MRMSSIKPVRNKSGMLLFVILGTIAIVFIVFMSMVDRVRYEAAITNRVAINERLYQVSSALGRLAIRKIQKKFELRYEGFGDDVFKAREQGKTGVVMSGSMTNELRGALTGIDVVDSLEKKFSEEWGNRGKLDFDVKYEVELLPTGFSAPHRGFIGEDDSRECKGYINITVDSRHLGVRKEFKIRKEFFLVRLLPAPFYRFTLFSRDGGDMQDKVANNTVVNEAGTKVGGQLPMVCVNRMLNDKKMAAYDFSGTKYDAVKENNFVKNGWIYLGGTGRSTAVDNKRGLILNIATGIGDDNFVNKFGEFFHFYYMTSSMGWVQNAYFTDRLRSLNYDPKNNVKFLHVDFGVYRNMPDILTPQGNVLFRAAFRAYDIEFRKRNGGNSCFNSSAKVWNGSSLRLYGTVKKCTPTLVFGPVMRRYVRTYALAFESKGVEKFFILSLKQEEKFEEDVFKYFEGNTEYGTSNIRTWIRQQIDKDYDVEVYDDFGKKFMASLGKPNFLSYNQIVPQVPDYEPYNYGLRNICDPGGVDNAWETVVGKVDQKYINTKNKCDDLLRNDYRFENDPNLHYNGLLNDIKVEPDYLKDRVTYRIPAEDGKVSLKNNKFFQDTFVTKDDKGVNSLFLNQIIEFEGDLHIDQDLVVEKGGIILCDGDITVDANILNSHLIEIKGSNVDNFGWLSLVSRKGNIIIKSKAGEKKLTGGTVPQLHAFLIARNNVEVSSRLHIIGGVVSSNIDSLVRNGCVVQWGFHPEEVEGTKDLTCRDFYGLTVGPRVVEIIKDK